jgi:hypothetical protein
MGKVRSNRTHTSHRFTIPAAPETTKTQFKVHKSKRSRLSSSQTVISHLVAKANSRVLGSDKSLENVVQPVHHRVRRVSMLTTTTANRDVHEIDDTLRHSIKFVSGALEEGIQKSGARKEVESVTTLSERQTIECSSSARNVPFAKATLMNTENLSIDLDEDFRYCRLAKREKASLLTLRDVGEKEAIVLTTRWSLGTYRCFRI